MLSSQFDDEYMLVVHDIKHYNSLLTWSGSMHVIGLICNCPSDKLGMCPL